MATSSHKDQVQENFVPWSHGKQRPHRGIKNCESVKAEFLDLYFQSNLEEARAAIEKLHGLKASPRTWKNNLRRWGVRKYKNRRQRRSGAVTGIKHTAAERDTLFAYGGTHVASQGESFERRKNWFMENSVVVEGNSRRESLEEFIPRSSSLSRTSRSCIPQDGSVEFANSEINIPQAAKPDLLTEEPPVSILDRYLSEELEPWTTHHVLHHLGTFEAQNAILGRQRRMFELITELVSLLEHPCSLYACEELIAQQNVNCTIYGIGDQFEPTCSLRSFDQEHNSCEVADLEEIFGLTATLSEYQYRHGEYAESTLKQEFELAKAADVRGYYEEAEYHCRRIVDREPQIVVETLLGMILAKTSRLEESRILLFSALTSFIIQFAFSDHTTNVLRYKHIERLFGELIRRSNEDWQSLTSCMCQMMAMIMNSESKGTMDQIFPQLITHGLSIAQECMALQFFDSAKSMYKLLLDYHKYSDEILYGIEIAEAHLEFGLILRMEDEWKESADHLVFACESAVYSGTHERLLLSRLEGSLDDIPPHVASTPYIKLRVERIRNLLALAQRQSSLIQATAEAARLSCMDDYLRSNLPVNFVTPAPSTVSTAAQFTSPRMPAGSVQTDGDCTSTTSNSSKIGLTWSDTIASGMSDVRYSQFMDLTSA